MTDTGNQTNLNEGVDHLANPDAPETAVEQSKPTHSLYDLAHHERPYNGAYAQNETKPWPVETWQKISEAYGLQVLDRMALDVLTKAQEFAKNSTVEGIPFHGPEHITTVPLVALKHYDYLLAHPEDDPLCIQERYSRMFTDKGQTPLSPAETKIALAAWGLLHDIGNWYQVSADANGKPVYTPHANENGDNVFQEGKFQLNGQPVQAETLAIEAIPIILKEYLGDGYENLDKIIYFCQQMTEDTTLDVDGQKAVVVYETNETGQQVPKYGRQTNTIAEIYDQVGNPLQNPMRQLGTKQLLLEAQARGVEDIGDPIGYLGFLDWRKNTLYQQAVKEYDEFKGDATKSTPPTAESIEIHLQKSMGINELPDADVLENIKTELMSLKSTQPDEYDRYKHPHRLAQLFDKHLQAKYTHQAAIAA